MMSRSCFPNTMNWFDSSHLPPSKTIMTHKTLNSRHALEYQFNTWKPFQLQTLSSTTTDLSNQNSPNNNKRPYLCDQSFSIDTLDMSKLSLFKDDSRRDKFQWMARKRRRKGSRSVSGGRSSDKSRTRRLSVGVSAGIDSSGELFVHGDVNWSSDVSEAKISRKDGSSSEKELVVGTGYWQIVDAQGNESGYGSEPGYRGDAEFGYGDEFDEEEEDARLLFWGERFGDTDCKMEIVGDKTFSEQKSHHRCRCKKHEWRMVDMVR